MGKAQTARMSSYESVFQANVQGVPAESLSIGRDAKSDLEVVRVKGNGGGCVLVKHF